MSVRNIRSGARRLNTICGVLLLTAAASPCLTAGFIPNESVPESLVWNSHGGSHPRMNGHVERGARTTAKHDERVVSHSA